MKSFTKKCPSCDCDITYTTKYNLDCSIKINSNCRKCSKKGTIPSFIIDGKMRDDVLEKTSKNWFKKGDRPKNADDRKGKNFLEIYGEEKALDIIKKFNSRVMSPESNEKRRETMKKRWEDGSFDNVKRSVSEETKNIHRLNIIKKLKETNKNFHPPYNKNACLYFDNLMLETNTYIQHALNGGEYHIKELGYWVDGYDVENNIVYEFDEKLHFTNDGVLKEKDIIRQNNIIKYLNCKFIRIKWDEVIL